MTQRTKIKKLEIIVEKSKSTIDQQFIFHLTGYKQISYPSMNLPSPLSKNQISFRTTSFGYSDTNDK